MSSSTLPTPQLRVVTRETHGISRKEMSTNALRVLYRLRDAGFAAYLVGGAVRDILIGGHPKDFDVATNATPEEVKNLFRNCRLIGRRFRLAHVMFGPEIIEVATFRASSSDDTDDRTTHDDGRILRDNVYGTIEEDAIRRDFTANALYYNIEDFSVRDFTGGYEDVQNKVLRLIGDAETRYREDPVRMLRAVRLAAKLDFTIDPAAAKPIASLAPLLSSASSARLFDECLKLFLSGHAEQSFLGMEQHGLLPVLFPEMAKALITNRSGALRNMLLQAMRNTDARIEQEKPVTPAFLFAALLWPAYCRELAVLQKQGVDLAVAQQRAADRVVIHQVERVALPRRFSLPMQEIWLLQARFAQRQRKRVFRLMAHPRFRAAFDFLELRLAATPEVQDDVDFWREAQTLSEEVLASRLEGKAPSEPGTLKKKRRRRPKKKTESTNELVIDASNQSLASSQE
jgi:poly(A) polymerase